MEGACQQVCWRKDVVELGEGIGRLLFRLVERKRQGSHRQFMQGVLDALRKVKAICDQRAVESDARRSISQTPQMAAANAELGQWIVELKMPLLAAAPRFD